MPDLDTTKLSLALFDANDELVTTGKVGPDADGNFTVDLTGLPAGRIIAAGAYKEAFTDGTNYGPKVALDGFNVANASDPSKASSLTDSAITDESTTE